MYKKMGKFQIGGVCVGQGHELVEGWVGSVKIPAKGKREVQIDFKKLAELQKWHEELKGKFSV